MQVQLSELRSNEQIELYAHGHYVQFIGGTIPSKCIVNVKLRGNAEMVVQSNTIPLPQLVTLEEDRVVIGAVFLFEM